MGEVNYYVSFETEACLYNNEYLVGKKEHHDMVVGRLYVATQLLSYGGLINNRYLVGKKEHHERCGES